MGCCETRDGKVELFRTTATQQLLKPILEDQDLDLKLNAVYSAISSAEFKKGKPVHLLDILKELMHKAENGEVQLPPDFTFACPKMCPYVFELFRKDEIMSDKMMDYFSVDPAMQCMFGNSTGFELCSDRLAKDFPQYVFDERGRVRPGADFHSVNFDYLKELLLSKRDRKKEARIQWANEDEFRFLDGNTNLWGDMVAFQSFPRSGNTFLRRYLEQITGVVTGADMNVEETLPEILWGLLGQ